MNCLNCGRPRTRFFVDGEPFCDEECYKAWRDKEKNKEHIQKEFLTDYV
jgi:hypothetical protein